MDTTFCYFNFEECIGHYKAHPPEGREIELDFTDDEIRHIKHKAAQYDCSVDVFLTAVMACFSTELVRKDRADDNGFAEAETKL